jgi:hypothetical protein
MTFLGRNFRQWPQFQHVKTQCSHLQSFCATEDRGSLVTRVIQIRNWNRMMLESKHGRGRSFWFHMCVSMCDCCLGYLKILQSAYEICVVCQELHEEYKSFRFRESFSRPNNCLRVLKSEVSLLHPLESILSRLKRIYIFTNKFVKFRVSHPMYELYTQERSFSQVILLGRSINFLLPHA